MGLCTGRCLGGISHGLRLSALMNTPRLCPRPLVQGPVPSCLVICVSVSLNSFHHCPNRQTVNALLLQTTQINIKPHSPRGFLSTVSLPLLPFPTLSFQAPTLYSITHCSQGHPQTWHGVTGHGSVPCSLLVFGMLVFGRLLTPPV